MTLDWDGKIRMDPSSPFAMARLVELRDRFDLALGNDADADRHGVVTPGAGLLNPNHVLSGGHRLPVRRRRGVGARTSASGKTLVSSSMIDRVVRRPRAAAGRGAGRVQVVRRRAGRRVDRASAARRAPGRRSCAATARSGRPTRTGSSRDLLACELTARLGRDPGEVYAGLTERFGAPAYRRIDAPATPDAEGGARAAGAGRRDRDRRSPATRSPRSSPRRRATTRRSAGSRSRPSSGWFAARPSGTENVAKVYAESFRGEDHLERLLEEAAGAGAGDGRLAPEQRDPRPGDRRRLVRGEEPERLGDLLRRRPRRLLRIAGPLARHVDRADDHEVHGDPAGRGLLRERAEEDLLGRLADRIRAPAWRPARMPPAR